MITSLYYLVSMAWFALLAWSILALIAKPSLEKVARLVAVLMLFAGLAYTVHVLRYKPQGAARGMQR